MGGVGRGLWTGQGQGQVGLSDTRERRVTPYLWCVCVRVAVEVVVSPCIRERHWSSTLNPHHLSRLPLPPALPPPARRPQEWLEVLGCGVMQQQILDKNLEAGHKAWAFG